MAAGDAVGISAVITPLGFGQKRAAMLKRFSQEYTDVDVRTPPLFRFYHRHVSITIPFDQYIVLLPTSRYSNIHLASDSCLQYYFDCDLYLASTSIGPCKNLKIRDVHISTLMLQI